MRSQIVVVMLAVGAWTLAGRFWLTSARQDQDSAAVDSRVGGDRPVGVARAPDGMNSPSQAVPCDDGDFEDTHEEDAPPSSAGAPVLEDAVAVATPRVSSPSARQAAFEGMTPDVRALRASTSAAPGRGGRAPDGAVGGAGGVPPAQLGRGAMSGGSAGARASTGESSRAADERRMHACLDIPIDAEVWSGELLAQRDPLSIAVEPGVDYYLVTRGVFRYSETGRQDGLRRWHEVYDFHEPVCVGCGVAEFEPYTLLADGAAPPWLQECLLEHIHVSLVRASAPTLSLRLSDDCGSCEDPYSDNVGGLAVALYRADGDDPLLARDRPGLRLGVEVGPSHETKWLGLDEAFAKLVYVAGKDHESFYQRHAAWTVEPADQWLVEVSGSAIVSAGVEVDPVAEIDHLQAGVTPVELPVRFECDATQLLAHDSSSHRAVVSLRGCGTQIVARLSDAYPHFIGQLRMTLFSAR